MGKFSGKFESAKQEWETPQWFFNMLKDDFRFTCDVAADHTNAKCAIFYCKECDGLQQKWSGVCWMNPPYKYVGKWVKKAYEESLGGTVVVSLIPARTNTRWWHNYCMKGQIRFLKGRLAFGGAEHGLPQPLAIVIFGRSFPAFPFETIEAAEGLWVGAHSEDSQSEEA